MTTKNAIFKTDDGSHSIYSNRFNESYHSQHGAIQESMHIFIESAFNLFIKNEITVFEVGFGTGLNAILTYIEAKKLNKFVTYETIELYPIIESEFKNLNFSAELKIDKSIFENSKKISQILQIINFKTNTI